MPIPKSQFKVTLSRERWRQLKKNGRGLCSISKCEKRVHRGGRCKGHYADLLKRMREAYAAKKGKTS